VTIVAPVTTVTPAAPPRCLQQHVQPNDDEDEGPQFPKLPRIKIQQPQVAEQKNRAYGNEE
jgi:hypothetical protein